VLAGNSALRKAVVPRPREEPAEEATERRAKRLTQQPRIHWETERPSWHDLLQRVFGVDGFQCPLCGGRLELRCIVESSASASKILKGLHKATGPP
jgi:hypothetical protein